MGYISQTSCLDNYAKPWPTELFPSITWWPLLPVNTMQSQLWKLLFQYQPGVREKPGSNLIDKWYITPHIYAFQHGKVPRFTRFLFVVVYKTKSVPITVNYTCQGCLWALRPAGTEQPVSVLPHPSKYATADGNVFQPSSSPPCSGFLQENIGCCCPKPCQIVLITK